MEKEKSKKISRRDFIATGAIAATAISGFPLVKNAHAQVKKKLKIGVIGCGGRGTGACANAIVADPGNVDLVAMADIAPDQIERSLKALAETRELQGELQNNIKVEKDHIFTGADCFNGGCQPRWSGPDDEQLDLFQLWSSSGPLPSWVSTRQPGVAKVWQALVLGTPLITIRHSKHRPIPQNRPRGSFLSTVRRNVRSPAAINAVATVSPR